MKEMNALRQEIRRRGFKLCALANMLGIASNTFRLKLDGTTQFNVDEVIRLSKILSLTPEQRDRLFFGDEEGTPASAALTPEEVLQLRKLLCSGRDTE